MIAAMSDRRDSYYDVYTKLSEALDAAEANGLIVYNEEE